MAGKYSDKPITKDILDAFIKTQDDFALELYAYSLARELEFRATHAGSYSDRVTGKTRQFDVRANRTYNQNFDVSFAIECKSLRPAFPLLVSRIPRLVVESYQEIIQSPGQGRQTNLGAQFYSGPGIRRLDQLHSLYPPNDYVGKALVQVGVNEAGGFVTNDHEVFDKWGQAIASASGLILQGAGRTHGINTKSHGSAVFPVLVIPDGTLWVANYAENGSLQDGPMQIDEVKFFIGDKQTFENESAFTYTISHLHIVTKTGLRSFLERFSPGGSDISHLLNFSI